MTFTLGPALLFCPADRPERFAKAITAADTVIIDLEDAVTPDAKASARAAVQAAEFDPTRVMVRVNPVRTPDFALDIAALATTSITTIMLAKTESVDDIAQVPQHLNVVALCETAAGVVNAATIAAHPQVIGLMWGAEDLIASLGGTNSRRADGTYRDVVRTARSTVLLSAGAHTKAAIDAVYMAIADHDGLAAECADAVASGFTATACIHPGQVPVIRGAYQPSVEQVRHATALLAAAEGARGAFQFEGAMIDEVMLRHARRVLERGRH
ncbi:CoA ester lyase [Microbacterium sp. NC79]|uniref:HpcH/HpaI aldolase/citrate lyase family protein n=1 Tax=Microbacterium sp. NC79 TaxID=2851009 RepID=UPI001C2BBEE1|nr:CoA ester lyase [Microbacterium sp. NC79]MBV0894857.1 CoA ester lyase [Microbacterium sp. NC79]